MVGVGSTFVLELPIAAPALPEERLRPAGKALARHGSIRVLALEARDGPQTLKQARILIVDDQVANIDLLKRMLEHDGFTRRGQHHRSPPAWCGICAQHPPDLLILDLHMPGPGRVRGAEAAPAVVRGPLVPRDGGDARTSPPRPSSGRSRRARATSSRSPSTWSRCCCGSRTCSRCASPSSSRASST